MKEITVNTEGLLHDMRWRAKFRRENGKAEENISADEYTRLAYPSLFDAPPHFPKKQSGER